MTICFLERAGCAGGGKGILCSEEKTFTLSTVDNMRICMQEVYSVDSKSSNSMKSSNPHSGFHVSKVFKTLDTSVPDPSKNQGGHIITVVRRLTPVECERLQGFPDGYTDIPWRGKPSSPDSRRYKALGNSMAVPVMRWIGERIEAAESIERDERAIERVLYVTPSDDSQLSLF